MYTGSSDQTPTGARPLIRVGILGAGRHSFATHGPALQAIAHRRKEMSREAKSTMPALELAAVCDLDPLKARRYADTFGFRAVYHSLEEMIKAASLDVLLLVTPLPLTETLVAKALPLGIPLLIEKPPGINPEETRRLVAIARQTRTPHMVSFNRRFNPALQRAMAWMRESPAERAPKTVVARMLRHNRREPDFATGTGIHLIDAVIALMGTPRQLQPAHSPIDPACPFFNTRLDFDGGASATLLIAPACGRHEEIIDAHGKDFSFQVDFVANRFRLFRENEIVEEWTLPASADPALADVIAETEHLLASLDQEAIHPNLDDGLISMLTSAAIQAGSPMDDIAGEALRSATDTLFSHRRAALP